MLTQLLVFVVISGGGVCLLQQHQPRYRDRSFCMSRRDAAFFITAATGSAAAPPRLGVTTAAAAATPSYQGFPRFSPKYITVVPTGLYNSGGGGGETASEQDTQRGVSPSSSNGSSRGEESMHEELLWSRIGWEGEGEWNEIPTTPAAPSAPSAPAAGGGSEEAMVGSPEFVSLVKSQFNLLATAVPGVGRVVLFVRRENTETGEKRWWVLLLSTACAQHDSRHCCI